MKPQNKLFQFSAAATFALLSACGSENGEFISLETENQSQDALTASSQGEPMDWVDASKSASVLLAFKKTLRPPVPRRPVKVGFRSVTSLETNKATTTNSQHHGKLRCDATVCTPQT